MSTSELLYCMKVTRPAGRATSVCPHKFLSASGGRTGIISNTATGTGVLWWEKGKDVFLMWMARNRSEFHRAFINVHCCCFHSVFPVHVHKVVFCCDLWLTYTCSYITPVDNFGTIVGENPDCLLLSGTVVGENPDHVCWARMLGRLGCHFGQFQCHKG